MHKVCVFNKKVSSRVGRIQEQPQLLKIYEDSSSLIAQVW